MFQSQRPDLSDLPTSKQLFRSTVLAAAVAATLLVTVVLPSEYAVDPTGIGRALGLTQMGEIKQQLEHEAAADAAADAVAPAQAPSPFPAAAAAVPSEAAPAGERSDTVEVRLEPGQGAEVKVHALRGASIDFTWKVEGGHVNYDTHGDPVQKPKGFYHGYGKGKESRGESGTLIAAFDGQHGWFWRNRSAEPVKVVLATRGAYSQIQRVL